MKTIKQKNKGKAVEELQSKLKMLGLYQAAVDGYFGPRVKDAVIQFQNMTGLDADGIVGPKTWKALKDKNEVVSGNPHLVTYRYWGPNTDNRDRSTFIDDETALWCARMCVGEGGRNEFSTTVTLFSRSYISSWL